MKHLSLPSTTNNMYKLFGGVRRSSTEAHNVVLCFKWLFIILFTAGCLCLRLHTDELRLSTANIIYTNIIRLLLLAGYIGGLSLKFTNAESAQAMLGRLTPVLKFVLVLEGVICVATYVQVSLALDKNKHAHLKLLQRLQHLDDRLKADFPCINFNYHKTVHKYTPLTKVIICFYFAVALLYLYNIANCSCDKLNTFVIATSYACITGAPGVISFLHLGTMDILRLRFRLIRRMLMHYLTAQKSYKNQPDLHARIRRLIGYCKSYVELVLQVNTVYGYACAAMLFYDFSILTNIVFLLCQKATESRTPAKEYIFISLFMLPRLYKLIITPVYGYVTHKERRNCIQTISAYGNYFPHNREVDETLNSFLHWKMQHRYDFTIGRMLRCDLSMLYMTIHGIANYVIILIQLQFQQNNIAYHLRNHDMAQDVELIPKSKIFN